MNKAIYKRKGVIGKIKKGRKKEMNDEKGNKQDRKKVIDK